MLVVLLLFTLVGCNQNEQMDEMAQKIAQLEQALQNQADVNDELSTELDEQKVANDWLGELVLTQQDLIDKQQKTIDEQQTQIGRAEEAIDNLLGKPIELTAKAPVYGPREGEILLANIRNDYSGDDIFANFMNYYNTEFRETFTEEFILLNVLSNIIDPCCGHNFYVYAENIEGEYVNPMIVDFRNVYDESIKCYDYYDWDREGIIGQLITASLSIYLAPIPSDFDKDLLRGDNFRLKFGEQETEENPKHYCNIYVGGTCIGTCYYSTNATLTYRWFERYFEENLFIGE